MVDTDFPLLAFLSSPFFCFSADECKLLIRHFQVVGYKEISLDSMKPPIDIHHSAIVVKAHEVQIEYGASAKHGNGVQKQRDRNADEQSNCSVAKVTAKMVEQLVSITNGVISTKIYVPETKTKSALHGLFAFSSALDI